MEFSAGIAQLVEHNLAKVGVASSSLVSRSMKFTYCLALSGTEIFWFGNNGGMAEWLCSGLQSRLRRFDSDSRLHNFGDPVVFSMYFTGYRYNS